MGGAGSTPIHRAAKEGNIGELRVAVQHYGARINDQEKDLGYSALHVAAWQGFDAIARELLVRGADPNLLDKEGRTALHLAALKGHGEVVRALLRWEGTKREVRDKLNHTPWDYCRTKHPKVAQMIGPPTLPMSTSAPVLPVTTSAPTPSAASASPAATPPQTPPAPLRPKAPSIYPEMPPTQPPPLAPGQTSAPPTPTPQYPQYPQYPQQARFPSQQQLQQPAVAPEYPARPGTYPHAQQPSAPSAPVQDQFQHQPQHQQHQQPPQPPQPQPQHVQHVQQLVQEAAGVALPSAQTSAAQSTSDFGAAHEDRIGQQGSQASGSVAPSPRPSDPGAAAPDAAEPSAPPPPPQHRNPLQSAADLAMQQLAKLGLGQPGNKPPLAHLMGGLAAAAAALTGQHQQAAAAAADPQRDGLANLTPLGATFTGACRMYRYEDLALATQNFAASNKIGQGGFGEVFKGVLDGVPVAIKVMDVGPEAMQGIKELTAEMNILSRLHHPHVVLLIGACPEKGLLVYELAEGGSLEGRLFSSQPHTPPLLWQDRVRIATETASALLYLHTATPSIVHMDIKPANILLDRTLRAKLGDVGLARLMGGPLPALQGAHTQEPSTAHDPQLVGTLAYVDPEYLRTGQFSPKSDVYALGMVMLQLLTGQEKRGVINTVEEARRNVLYFAYVLDTRAGEWPAAEAMAFADIALKCTQFRRHDRPDLRTEVLPALLQLKQRTVLYTPPDTATSGGQRQSTASLASQQGPPSSNPSSVMGPMQGGVPAMFICPITQDIMRDPVVAADGYTYERDAIAAWLSKSATSPLTNLPLAHTALVPNMLVRSAVRNWQEQQQRTSVRA